ncbi:MAG: hypothetical protein ACK5YR_13785 [Pirellula sp.]|jgi:hypothetical protein
MPTAVVPIVMVVNAVVMPVIIPVVIAVYSPTRTRKSRVDIPIGPIGKPISNAVTNVDAVANVNVCVVTDTWTISTNTRPVDNIVIVAVDVT